MYVICSNDKLSTYSYDKLNSWDCAVSKHIIHSKYMLHPQMSLASKDDISPSLDELLGWHFSIHRLHPWMTLLHSWMTSMDGTFIHGLGFSFHGWNFHLSNFLEKLYASYFQMSPVDESVIVGCHPWMFLPSVDVIHEWNPRMKTTDDGHGRSNCSCNVYNFQSWRFLSRRSVEPIL